MVDHPGRRSLRLPGYDYSQAGGYFITVVTLGRDYLFGEVINGEAHLNHLGLIVEECWLEIPSHFPNVTVDVFVIMPNHVHGILFIHEISRLDYVGAQHAAPLQAPLQDKHVGGATNRNVTPGSLGAIVRSFKSAVTYRAGRELDAGKIWQRNYYEHILRHQADYEQKAAYILANPSNWDSDEENRL